MTPGDGNFHTMLLFDPADPEEYKRCKEVAERMARWTIMIKKDGFQDVEFELLKLADGWHWPGG